MQRITEKDLDTLKFDGIIVSVPRDVEDGQHNDISFITECNYYTNGKHGYEEPGHGADNSSFYHICYNMDCLPFGLWMNATSRFTIEHSFRFDSYDYYKFDSLVEFCEWYLQRNKYEVWIPSGDLKGKVKEIKPRKETTAEINIYKKVDKTNKEWIHEKCGTNTPPTSVPEKPSVGNKKKMSLNDKLITERMDAVFKTINKLPISESEKIGLYEQIRGREKHSDYIMKLHNEIANDVLRNELHDINNEMVYWNLYNNPETDEKLKRLIEEEWPEFKERPPQNYVRTIGEEGKPEWVRLMSQEEIREKINPGWKTRRSKYSDIIELIEKIVDHKIQQFILNEKIRKTDWEVFAEPLRNKLKEINNQFERWLDEEC